MADIFISYAREDREWVEKLAATLQAEGFSVWWDWDLLVGKRYRETIETELQQCQATIVVWSQHSIRSDFVRDEAEEGQQRNLLLPVLKEAVRPPAGFRQIQTADLTAWTGDRTNDDFRRMMRGVSHLVGRQANQPETTPLQDPAPAPVQPAAPVMQAPPTPVPPPAPPKPDPVVMAKATPTAEPAPQPKPATAGAPPFAVPAAFAGLSGKVPPVTHPIWRYVAIGVVGLIALIFLISQLVPSSTKPHGGGGGGTVVHNDPNAPNADGDQAGNTHGLPPSNNTTPPPPPPPSGDGSDVGQGSGNGGQGTTPPAPNNSGGDTGGGDSGDVGQGR